MCEGRSPDANQTPHSQLFGSFFYFLSFKATLGNAQGVTQDIALLQSFVTFVEASW